MNQIKKVLFLTSTNHPQIKLEAEALSNFLNVDYIVVEIFRSDVNIHLLIRFFLNLPKLLIALSKLKIPPIPSKVFLSSLLATSRLIDNVREKKYDLIYSHWLYPAGLVGVLLSKVTNSKTVSVVWGYDIQVLSCVKHYGSRGIKRVFAKLVLLESDLVIVNHKVHKVLAEHLAGPSVREKIIYIPPAIPDLTLNAPTEPTDELKEKLAHILPKLPEKKVILYSPSLRPLYGIREFVKAAPIINATKGDCVFVVVGEGELEDEAKKIVKSFNLENKFLFLGKVSHESMMFLYKISTVVCDLAYTGTGTTTLEAFCFGKPVIGIHSPKTVIEDGITGFTIRRGDFESLAKYIIEILNNDKLRETISKNARKVYEEKFSMQNRVTTLLMIFLNIAKYSN